MPAPLIGALIAAGSTLASSGINAMAQGKMNRRTMRYNKEMYKQQRADALADWTMMNEYNSPAAQMLRFQDAGLNPNLIYGQTNEAPAVKSPDVKSWDPKTVDFDLGGAQGVAAFQDARIKNATIDNLEKQREIMVEDAKLKAAQTLKTMADTDHTRTSIDTAEWELAMKNQMAPFQLEAAGLQNEKLKADTAYTKNSDRRAAQQHIQNLVNQRLDNAKTQAEIKQITLASYNLVKDSRLKDLEIDMRSKGGSWSDPLWQRKLNDLWSQAMKEAAKYGGSAR